MVDSYWTPQTLTRIILIIFVAVVIFVLPSRILGTFERNLGWLHLAAALVDREDTGRQTAMPLQLAAESFQRAVKLSPSDRRAWRGLAIAAAHLDNLPMVVTAWRESGATTDHVLEYARHVKIDDPAVKLLYYRSAEALSPQTSHTALYAAAGVCQRHWAERAGFSHENTEFCETLVQANGENLLFNGAFDDDIALSWEGQFFFTEETHRALYHDGASGVPPPSAVMQGITARSHHGIYQSLCLHPGTQIRFSARFRIEPQGDFEARLLFIGWQVDEQGHGNQRTRVQSALDWTEISRTFILPTDAEPEVVFQPLVLTGMATVWVDDVRVEIVDLLPETERIDLPNCFD